MGARPHGKFLRGSKSCIVRGKPDHWGRPLRELRISVTDRCNFRCRYCMPREIFHRSHRFLPRAALLDFEELERVARLFVQLGVEKIRLTGGEPLLRRDLPRLVKSLAVLPGLRELCMTSNAALLNAERARQLHRAGLSRLTVSLDALEDALFRRVADVNIPVSQVLGGIASAEEAGFSPLGINMVVRRGLNESQILPLARYFHGSGHILRFIEYMDVGNSNGWRQEDVLSAEEILQRLEREFPLQPVTPQPPGGTARYWRYRDGGGRIGIIASVTQPFCGECTRIRLSADGQLYTCLFATTGHDLRTPLRAGASDKELLARIGSLWQRREDRYSEQRALQQQAPREQRIEMSYIGG